MKKILIILFCFSISLQNSFAQNQDDFQSQMQEMMQKMMEEFQKNFEGNSFFEIDTMRLDGFGENFMMPFDGNSFFFSDTLMMDSFGNGDLPALPFSGEAFGMNLNEILKQMQERFEQMSPEELEELGKMFEGFQFGQPFFLNPKELEKLKKEHTPGSDSIRKRKTIRI